MGNLHGVARKRTPKLIGTARVNHLSTAENPRVRDAINNLYREGATIRSGSSMDALRANGSHLIKVQGRQKQLLSILKEETLNATDKRIVRDLLLDIDDALRSYAGGAK